MGAPNDGMCRVLETGRSTVSCENGVGGVTGLKERWLYINIVIF